MGRKTLEQQIAHVYHEKIAFGESRHLAKEMLREELGDKYRFGMSDDKIHSVQTFKTYSKVGQEYSAWLIKEKALGKYSKFENTEQYAKEYIAYRLENGVSVWTAKMERSALSKLYNKTIEMEMPVRNQSDVTRSRNSCEHDKHFSVKKHSSEILVASATGTRREDLRKIAIKDFEEHNNHLYVRINGSKGGRNRLAPVLPTKEQEIKNFLADMRTQGKKENEPLFHHVSKNMDVHAYRRSYAKDLLDYVEQHKNYKEDVLKQYPERHEYKTITNKQTSEKEIHEIKSEYYSPRDEDKRYLRDDLYIVSQGLGHNRLDVTLSYIK